VKKEGRASPITWKCRICGAEEISVEKPPCPYKNTHVDMMDPRKDLSGVDLYNLDYGRPAV